MKKLVIVLFAIFCLCSSIFALSPDDPGFDAEQARKDLSHFVDERLQTAENLTANVLAQSIRQEEKFNIDFNEKQVYVIDSNNAIIVENGMLIAHELSTIEATPNRIAKGAIDVSKLKNNTLARAAYGVTDITKHTATAYNQFNAKLFDLTQEAQFTYTGSSASVNYSDAYYTKGFLSIWQVSNFKDSVASSVYLANTWCKEVRSAGNFHYGIEYDGNGLVIQDKHLYVLIRCSVYGVVHWGDNFDGDGWI